MVKSHELYLGLSTFSLRSKRLQFAYLRERIIQKMQGWNSKKLFSMGGREVLIKSVLQAIPSYAMSCFKILISLRGLLNKLALNFGGMTREEKEFCTG